MTRSLIALWLTLLAAIITIAVLAQFWLSQRQTSAQQRVSEILAGSLVAFDDAIERLIAGYAVDMQRQSEACDLLDPASCVQLTRSPLVSTLVVVDSDSRLVFPTDFSNASADRQSLIDEAQQLLREMADPRPAARQTSSTGNSDRLRGLQQSADQDLKNLNSRSYINRPLGEFEQAKTASAGPAQTPAAGRAAEESAAQAAAEPPDRDRQATAEAEFGWITWYHRRGMVLGFWWKQGQQRRGLATIPRARWMADIVAALPDTDIQGSLQQAVSTSKPDQVLNQLIDVEGTVIYQWGGLPSGLWSEVQQREPDGLMSVSEPLEGWRLRVFASDAYRQVLAGENAVLPLWLAVAGISLALVLGGILATISFNRQLRQAAQRVSFVNQVSHELRTPLTNICMYADLVARSLDGESAEDAPNRQRIAVIQSESQRLGRLISNVLQYARDESHPSDVKLRDAVVDDVVRDVLAAFEPRLNAVGLAVSEDLAAQDVRRIDTDIIEQILVNLVSNAEKYAANGKCLEIRTRENDQQVDIWVRDDGPGVPNRMSERIFLPFVRVSDRLDAPAGTGIGLTIARSLARKHGGDCRLLPSQSGAVFHCTLHAPAPLKNSADTGTQACT